MKAPKLFEWFRRHQVIERVVEAEARPKTIYDEFGEELQKLVAQYDKDLGGVERALDRGGESFYVECWTNQTFHYQMPFKFRRDIANLLDKYIPDRRSVRR